MKKWMSLCVFAYLAGCAVNPSDIGVAPHLTPAGNGLGSQLDLPSEMWDRPTRKGPVHSLWDASSGDLFRDARAAKVGDVIAVNIMLNDSATFAGTFSRNKSATEGNSFEAQSSITGLTGKPSASYSTNTRATTKNDGTADRAEKIQVSIAAVVTQVLPNGNLFISGSQEVRVNFELRDVLVSGIVRPRDINRDNTVSYDKIAEARISYGGRGRIMEVMQPTVWQQIWDVVQPF